MKVVVGGAAFSLVERRLSQELNFLTSLLRWWLELMVEVSRIWRRFSKLLVILAMMAE